MFRQPKTKEIREARESEVLINTPEPLAQVIKKIPHVIAEFRKQRVSD